ncbi:hypothetical protein KCU67_g6000, partial [Aureobasidium melanogenum]
MEAEKWSVRFSKVVDLFNDGQFSVAAKEARVLLKGPEIPDYYHIRCFILLARSTTELWEVQISYDCAKYIWTDMRSRWPAETTNPRGKQIMNKLRCMLNELSADKLAIWPENTDYIPGLGKGQAHLAEENEDIPPDAEEGDIFVEDAERLGQKEKETALIRSDNVEAEIDDDYLTLFPFNNNNNNNDSNRESVSTEQSLVFNVTDKSKTSSFPLSSVSDFESPLKTQQTPFSFTPIRVVPDSTYNFASASRLRQIDADTSPTPGHSEKKKATIPGLSTPPIKKQDTKIDKPKMTSKDVPDELSSKGDTAGGKSEKGTMSEVLHSDQHEESLKSKPSSSTKVKHSASIRSSRTRPTFCESTAPTAAKATSVSVQAEVTRSSNQPVLDTSQSGLSRSSSTPLLDTSQNAGIIQKDGQTVAQESLRSSLRDSLNTGWTSLKSSTRNTIGTLGRTLTHRNKRRPESTAGSVLGDSSQEGLIAGPDKRHKRKESQRKSSINLNNLFSSARK